MVAGPATGNGEQSRPGRVVVVVGGKVVEAPADPTVTVVFGSARIPVQPEAVNATTTIIARNRLSVFDTTKA